MEEPLGKCRATGSVAGKRSACPTRIDRMYGAVELASSRILSELPAPLGETCWCSKNHENLFVTQSPTVIDRRYRRLIFPRGRIRRREKFGRPGRGGRSRGCVGRFP